MAGLHWPGEPGLDGHSDADVAAHACCDALFSAAGIGGDLGAHFGTARPEPGRGLRVTLLAEAARLVRAAGFEIGNLAVQVIGNRPGWGRHPPGRGSGRVVGGGRCAGVGQRDDHRRTRVDRAR